MIVQSLAVLAYIDPGTGSIVLQVVLAGVFAAGVVFRRLLKWPLAFFLGKPRTVSTGDADESELISGHADDSSNAAVQD